MMQDISKTDTTSEFFDDIDKMSKHSSCLEMFRLVDQGSDWAKKSMNALSSLKNSFKDEMES